MATTDKKKRRPPGEAGGDRGAVSDIRQIWRIDGHAYQDAEYRDRVHDFVLHNLPPGAMIDGACVFEYANGERELVSTTRSEHGEFTWDKHGRLLSVHARTMLDPDEQLPGV